MVAFVLKTPYTESLCKTQYTESRPRMTKQQTKLEIGMKTKKSLCHHGDIDDNDGKEWFFDDNSMNN